MHRHPDALAVKDLVAMKLDLRREAVIPHCLAGDVVEILAQVDGTVAIHEQGEHVIGPCRFMGGLVYGGNQHDVSADPSPKVISVDAIRE